MTKVGILGGGQLAQLLALVAPSLDIQTVCLCEHAHEPASRYSKIILDDDKPQTLQAFADEVDVITLENENVALERLGFLQQFKPVLPGPQAIANSQDRFLEKSMFLTCNIPTVPFANITSEAELTAAWHLFNRNALLKTRRFGYDGKGQIRIQNEADLAMAWEKLHDQPVILEGFLPFDFEVSLIGARNRSGQVAFYPLIKNTHQDGILHCSMAPYVDTQLQEQAEEAMRKLFTYLDYVGVLAFEFFVKDQQLYANEIAPRVHNSGHLTLDGASISQFHLHLLSILDKPLPTPIFNSPCAMINLIGTLPKAEQVLAIVEDAHYYDYGKSARPGRKLGHINITASHPQDLKHKLALLERISRE